MKVLYADGGSEAEDILYVIHHSTAHLMAQAVQRLYPDAKLAISPPIDNGTITILISKDADPEDLPKIEERCARSSRKFDILLLPCPRELIRRQAGRAIQTRAHRDLPEDATISFYPGEFTDLCAGHILNTDQLGVSS